MRQSVTTLSLRHAEIKAVSLTDTCTGLADYKRCEVRTSYPETLRHNI